MKKFVYPLLIFGVSFLVYFAVATNLTFHPKWALDYFNPLAQSLLKGHLDIMNPAATYDLVEFQGKWYAPWGILPAIFLTIPQIILNRFIPTIYLSVLFSSLDIVIMYLILRRIKKDFLPEFSTFAQLLVLVFFAFGTVHFYVGTLGSVWHVDQMVSNFLGTLGIYFIFKKNRTAIDYLLAVLSISLSILGRATIVMLISLPALLYFYQYKLWSVTNLQKKFKEIIIIFGLPLALFSFLFFLYNFFRFGNPLEYGYSYIKESAYLSAIRMTNGAFSVRNLPRNLWYMLFEIPSLTFDGKLKFLFNLNGNSIFFLSPPLLAVFLANPLIRKGKKLLADPYISSLWITAIIAILPSLLVYSTGWMQFSYRYSLDITAILVILSVFGIKGRLNVLYIIGIIFAIVMYLLGTFSLM